MVGFFSKVNARSLSEDHYNIAGIKNQIKHRNKEIDNGYKCYKMKEYHLFSILVYTKLFEILNK